MISCAQNCEIPGCTACRCYFEVIHSQFHGAKFLDIQHRSVKCSYSLLFLGMHIKAPETKLSQCKITEGQEEPLSDTTTSRAGCFRQFTILSTIFSVICISTIFPANCTTYEIANLFFKTKKTTSQLTYKAYS